ncbi:thermonuclease family protein [Heyndrickxia ginsengihumi]|uniref:thermonuclease family protein n=1 Tax=Heyndrickxia ginsengihumi TaxID=363870 RepID=UPI00068DC5B2|nr:thermonuclease family protein [Heyndrickxia ginsengihumi]
MKKVLTALLIIFFSFSLVACSETSSSSSSSTKADTEQTNTKSHTEKISSNNDSEKKTANDDDNSKSDDTTTKANATANNDDTKKEASSKANTPSNQHVVTLVQTVDGDTIKVNYNGKVETVRYLLVDTPEEKKPGTCVQPYAVSAYNENKKLVNSGKLSLEFETNGDKRDKYGRLLAYVFVDGKSVQEELLKEGYARVAYIYNPPYKYLSKYQSDEKIAKNKHLNIWSQSGFVTDKGFNGCAAGSSNNSTTSTDTNKSTTTNTSSNTNQASTGSGASTSNASGNSNAFQNTPSDDKESNLSCKGKIKGNANTKIYHEPGDAYYNRTKDNIVWFCSEAQAEAAGYRASEK